MRLHIGVCLFQLPDQLLDLLALGLCLLVRTAGRAGVGEAAGALNKVQVVGIAPRLDVVLADQIHRANQLHAGKVRAVELRHHRLHLRAPEHAHENRLNDIVIVMPQRDLVAAELLGKAVEIASSHARAEVAGRLFHIVNGAENVRLENLRFNAESAQIAFYDLPVCRAVAGVHDEEFYLERIFVVQLQLLK